MCYTHNRVGKGGGVTMTAEKELKKQIRALRKLKRDTQIGTPERRQINRQIRELKAQKDSCVEDLTSDETKQKLVNKITEYYKRNGKPIVVDFRVYNVNQLEVHLNKLKGHKSE